MGDLRNLKAGAKIRIACEVFVEQQTRVERECVHEYNVHWTQYTGPKIDEIIEKLEGKKEIVVGSENYSEKYRIAEITGGQYTGNENIYSWWKATGCDSRDDSAPSWHMSGKWERVNLHDSKDNQITFEEHIMGELTDLGFIRSRVPEHEFQRKSKLGDNANMREIWLRRK